MKIALISLAIGLGIAVVAQQTTSTSGSQQTSKSSSTSSVSASSSNSGSGASQSVGSSGNLAGKPTHAVIWMPGEKWVEDKRTTEQPFFSEHTEYLRGLIRTGRNYMSGPWRDDPGGLTLLRVKSDAEADTIVENDPMVKAGVLEGEVRAWTVLMDGSAVPISTRNGG